MKVKLFYIHPTNYGNLMMACAFMQHFRDMYVKSNSIEPEFYLDVLDEEELDRVKASLPEGIKVYREDLYDRKKRGLVGKLKKLFNIPREIKFNQKNYDICVVLGGDCISQYYSKQVFISDMVKFKAISKKTKMYLLGQTMGPFSGYAIKLVQKSLKNCYIYLRDHDCYEYIRNTFNFDKIYEARDLAFLDIPFQNDKERTKSLIEKYTTGKEYITVVASGANRQYTSNEDDYVSEYIKIISKLIDTTNYDILLLAHVIHVSDSNDKRIIDKIVERIEPKYLERISVVNHLLHPYEARTLIGNGLLTITGRMHAAVSSINMGTVPICLSYSVKFKGVIGDDFNLNDYIYQCRGEQLWSDGSVSNKVVELVNQVISNRNEILAEINDNLSKIQKKSLEQIENVLTI